MPLSCISFCLLCSLSNDGTEDQRQARQYRWPAALNSVLKRKEKALPASLVHDARTGLSISSSC